MLLQLPTNLHYPITITKVEKRVGDSVAHNDAIFIYSYTVKVKQEERYEVRREDDIPWVDKKLVTHFSSTLEGTIKAWRVWEGDVIAKPVDVCEIEEECPHTVQFLGMCTNCGKDMTGVVVGSGTVDTDRAPIRMAHDTAHLTISKDEANRIDDESKRRLLSARKLSLVVDLDQTIIHAAVDPTIREWMDDKDNPNHEAVSDVRRFQLPEDRIRDLWYYIKLRPGLADFLEHISQIYELHIYTMGTRQYAMEIAKLVDPDHKYFSDRILSRDESGSMQVKSLERLFPIDNRMVVIIDDRGDVWQWCANLIKVTQFNFFLGIGDINSSFLPKQPEAQPTAVAEVPRATIIKETANGTQNGTDDTQTSNGGSENGAPVLQNGAEVLEQLIAMSGDDSPAVRELQAKDQETVISTQLEEKPLLKMQLQQDQKDEAAAAANVDVTATQNTEPDSSESSDSADLNPVTKQKPRHSILRNDDEELIYLEERLTKIHEAFYAEYDRKRVGGKGGRVAELTGKRKAPLPSEDDAHALDLKIVPDVKRIIPPMKLPVLSGVRIVLSGIYPLEANLQKCDIPMWAKTFGATITDKVSRDVTHVIAAKPGTAKVKQAIKRGIKVVNQDWVILSMQQFRKLNERPYLLTDEQKQKHDTASEVGDNTMDRSNNHANDMLLSSSDDETTGVETEEEQPARKKLKLDVPKGNTSEYQAVIDDGSPVTINDDERADIDAELKEFLGSDAESESDTDSVSSALSIRGGRSGKRRRADDDGDDDSSVSDVDRSPAKKRNGTGSALKSVKTLDSPPLPDVKNEQKLKDAAAAAATEAEDSDDELARELEREMEELDSEELARTAAG